MARAIKHIKAGLLHVEVIGTIPEREPGRRRAGRCRPTCAAQQFYNNKCSWHELELKLATNFGGRDWVLTLTYDDGHLPPDKRSADKFLQKFFRKLRTARRRRKEELRYIYATEGWHRGRLVRGRRQAGGPPPPPPRGAQRHRAGRAGGDQKPLGRRGLRPGGAGGHTLLPGAGQVLPQRTPPIKSAETTSRGW